MKLPTITLSLKYSEDVKQSELHHLTTSQSASDILRKCFNSDTFLLQEQFIVLMVNQSNRVIGYYPVLNGSSTEPFIEIVKFLEKVSA